MVQTSGATGTDARKMEIFIIKNEREGRIRSLDNENEVEDVVGNEGNSKDSVHF